ncbi:MAG: FAD-binding oxidoreductase [Spartobacteria bacterium]|nr:FAD-binding oxidoreductase [Spartobacteria bacterium]
MKKPDVGAALTQWRDVIGAGHVLTAADQLAEYEAALCGTERAVAGVLRPDSTEAVQRIVEIARVCHVPLYPVSGGRNWGLGSRLPVQADSVIVDLGRMNRIHEVNAVRCYAEVEPGVTQQQLYEYIQAHDLPVCMNVTGSSRDASLIGNALERGVGYFDSKHHELCNVEVVLGNGKVVRTGFGHYPGAQTGAICPTGVGPDITGLFSQSNFGIVTRAVIRLLPETEMHAAIVCQLDEDDMFSSFIDALADLRRDGVVRTAAHIVNRERSRISVCPMLFEYLIGQGMDPARAVQEAEEIFRMESPGAWGAVIPLRTSRKGVLPVCAEVHKRLKGLARVQWVTDRLMRAGTVATRLLGVLPSMRRKHAMLAAIRPFYGMTKGIPTDAALASVAWPVQPGAPVSSDALDRGDAGLLYCLPVIPMEGRCAVRLKELVHEVFAEYAFTPYISMNMMSAQALECVINLAYDKRLPGEAERADECIRRLFDACMQNGFIPYRAHINHMGLLCSDEDDTFWQTIREIKALFDPAGIIAPGRYQPPS